VCYTIGYFDKYNDLWGWDQTVQYYVYVDGMNNWGSSGSIGPVMVVDYTTSSTSHETGRCLKVGTIINTGVIIK